MKKLLLGLFLTANLFMTNLAFARHEDVMNNTTQSVASNIDRTTTGSEGSGVKNLLIRLGSKIAVPIMIMIGILLAIIGFYGLFFSNAADKQSNAKNYILRGVVGVIIAVSAGYFGETLVGASGTGGVLQATNVSGVSMASRLYDQLIFPFLKLAMFLTVGILFLVLLVHFLKFIWGASSEDVTAHSKRIVIWNTIGILVILSAEKMVSIIYGRREELANSSRLSQVGTGLLTIKNMTFLYTIINWLLGLIAFLVLVFIIYQVFLLLTKPDDTENMKKLTRSFIYIFVGIVLIGAAYLLTNFVMISWA